MAINLTGGLPPEILGQQQQLNRQQQMAQMLMQQSSQQPQGQMVGGRYVQPSIFAQLAPLAQLYAGQKIAEKGDKQALELATALRKRYGDELSQYQDLMNPKQTEMAGPTPTGAPLMSNAPDRQAANLFAASAYNPALQAVGMKNLTQGPKWEKASFTDEKTGKTREGVINTNSDDPISTFQIGGVKPEMSAYERASLNLKAGDQAISRANLYYNTGMGAGGGMPTGAPMGNAPAGAPMNAPTVVPTGAPTGNAPAMPMGNAPAQPATNTVPATAQPQYKYNPALSPKRNEELAIKFYEKQDTNTSNAKENFDLLKSASTLLSSGAPSSGRFSNIATGAGEAVGYSGKASKADARLNLLSGALTMKQPRFEGPQGVLDVVLYQKLAGDLGNANIPIATRLGNIEEMIGLQKKYYPEGDWDSISTKMQDEVRTEAARAAGKVSVGAPQYAVNPKTGERIVSTDGGNSWKPTGTK
jgi:hypothetical protein